MKIKRTVLIIIFIAVIFSITGLDNVNAGSLTSGQTYSYYANRHRNGGFVPYVYGDPEPLVFHVNNLIGTCIQAGINVNSSASGNAVITELTKDNPLTKVAYYWGIQKGYASDLDQDNYKFLVKANQYTIDAERTTTVMNNNHWSESDIERVKSMVTEAQSVTVPNNFTAYRGTPSDNSQNFVVWETEEFFAKKEYNCDTPNGLNHSLVKNGDTIIYDITWRGGTGIIKDTLSKGLTYVQGSSNIGEPQVSKNSGTGTTVLTWTTTEASGVLTYSVKVEAPDPCSMNINKVQNNASMTVDNKPYQLAELDNPLPSKCYAPMPNDGYNGKKVSVGDDIKYQITLTNVKNEVVTAYVTDIISRGLTYNKDATVNTGQITAIDNQEIDSNGNNKLRFTISLPAKSTVVLTYSAKVNSKAAVKVLNNASVRYDNERLINLNQLENPVYTPTPEEKVIPTPDTGSNVAILGILSGLALVGVGGYFIYKKYKKQ